jgi:hypothetical protein
MANIRKMIVFGTELFTIDKREISTNTTINNVITDARLLITEDDVTVTLDVVGNTDGAKVEIFTSVYSVTIIYTDAGGTKTLSLTPNSCASFIANNDVWIYSGIFGAVWN